MASIVFEVVSLHTLNTFIIITKLLAVGIPEVNGTGSATGNVSRVTRQTISICFVVGFAEGIYSGAPASLRIVPRKTDSAQHIVIELFASSILSHP